MLQIAEQVNLAYSGFDALNFLQVSETSPWAVTYYSSGWKSRVTGSWRVGASCRQPHQQAESDDQGEAA